MRSKTRIGAALARLAPHATRLTFGVALCAMLASCGFQLRGQATLPFQSMFISGSPSVATQIARAVRAGSKTRIVNNAKEADVTLELLSEARERTILSLSSSGRVRELQIRYRIAFRVYDKTGREYIAPSEVVIKRDLIYSDSDVLGKEQEELLLYRDMQNDAVQQIIRRLEGAQTDTGSGAGISR
jgi:LPS-assembly lipoprotein